MVIKFKNLTATALHALVQKNLAKLNDFGEAFINQYS